MGVRIVTAREGIAEAVERLNTGRLVAFPTETVYGLGADARSADAVARIFAAKGRPSTNPVIVHVADKDTARTLASEWPAVADTLAERFWPGPLTLVVPRADTIPDIVTASGPTVGIRVPNHPVALELLRRSGVPTAAPSANRSEEVSPTTAQHVADSLGPFVDDLLILDGGPCTVGIESTVLDVTTAPSRILRPGMVTQAMIAALQSDVTATKATSSIARSPGQRKRHYAPRVPVIVAPMALLRTIRQPGDIQIPLSREITPEVYAAHLYEWLRSCETTDCERILIEEPPHEPGWEAIHDRLRRASATKEE